MKYRMYLICAILSVGYLLAAILGLSLAVTGTNVSPVWPPAGIALATMLLFGHRVWPGIAAGAFLANYLIGLSAVASIFTAVGNTVEAIVATFFIHRWIGSRNPLIRGTDVFYFLLAVILGAALAATVGTSVSYATGFAREVPFSYLWVTWWLGDTGGIIVLTPLLIAWGRRPKGEWGRFQPVRFLLALTLLCLCAFVVFGGLFDYSVPLSYLTLLPLLVVAFNFDARGTSTGVFALSLIAIWMTIQGKGPFQGDSVAGSLLLLQLFIATVSITGLIVSAVIAEKREAENTIRNQLLEKELLLKEIHHRVKNNLQVISSLLGLQFGEPYKNVAEMLKESQNRIRSMALVHEQLYSASDLGRIKFGVYIRDLISQLFEAYAVDSSRITAKIDCEDVVLDIQQAVPCALILTEIVSNSLKYAFNGNRSGEIAIRCACLNGKVLLEAEDTGPGLPDGVDSAHSNVTLGLRLISLLVKQLNGKMDVNSTGGTKYRIEF